jgi:hypothetical protein
MTTGPRSAWLRLAALHLASRRVPAAAAVIAFAAVGLRIALLRSWDSYGAYQLPLIAEAGCAAVIAVTTGSPLGDCERAAGRWLPVLRLGTTLALTVAAIGALAAAGSGAQLAGGTLEVARNLAGLTGIGLLFAAALGGGLAWVGPTGYLIAGLYALYSLWHPPAVTTPWIWPSRPPHDLGAASCAGLVFACGLLAVTVRGARDPADE